MALVDTEQVLVVPAEAFHRLGHFQGICTDVKRYLEPLLAPELVSFRPRGEMERDPSFKQLIPYVIFQFDDPQGQKWLFQYTRGAGQGEKRLHRKRSIGIGGHICIEDTRGSNVSMGTGNPYHEGMRRELAEEVVIETGYEGRLVGLLNDDETDVGRVHLGIVHIFSVSEPAVRPREETMHDAGFERLEELWAVRDTMESWSRICLESLYGPLIR
jgi:predicted NUDIX family phosphoesterase